MLGIAPRHNARGSGDGKAGPEKADPMSFFWEIPKQEGSRVGGSTDFDALV